MAKFSVEYVKKNPIMFGAIVVVFGLIFWLLISRGSAASGGGGGAVVAAGPSDAEVAANMNLSMAQMQMQTQLAGIQGELAARTIEANLASDLADKQMAYSLAELAASERIADKQMAAQLTSMDMQLTAQLQAMIANNQFAVDYASLAYDAAVEQTRLGAELQVALGQQQLDAYKFGALVNTIPSMKKKDRDKAFRQISELTYAPDQYTPIIPSGGGGGGLLDFAGGLVGVLT